VTELATQQAACRPAAAAAGLALPDVKVEFAGPNLVLKTVSHRAPGQALKIIAALESLSLQILHVSVSAVDDTMLHSFTIKVCSLHALYYTYTCKYMFLSLPLSIYMQLYYTYTCGLGGIE
jgi:hypothetical protein